MTSSPSLSMETHRPRPPRAPVCRRLIRTLGLYAWVMGSVLLLCGPAGATSDPWAWPVQPPTVVHGFDPPSGPYGPGHRGVDLAAGAGQAVLAAGDGIVSFAGQVAGIGVVTIDHGELSTTYQPLASWVSRGASVTLGDPIGTLGVLGAHCSSPCLHWGVLREDDHVYLDPLSLVRPGPSRLLPYSATDGGEAPLGAGPAGDPARRAQPLASRAAQSSLGSAPGTSALSEPGASVSEREPPPAGLAAGIAVGGGVLAAVAAVVIMRRRH